MQDWKDSDLKALFVELREGDGESATPFEQDWGIARSRMAARRWTSFRYVVVAALSVLVVALSTAVIVRIVRPPSPKTQQGADGQGLAGWPRDLVDRYPSVPDTSAPFSTVPGAPPAGMTAPGVPAGRAAAIKRGRRGATAPHRNPDLGAYQDQVLISTWRSPTDFLLKSAAGDWLRTTPDIRDSLVKIDGR